MLKIEPRDLSKSTHKLRKEGIIPAVYFIKNEESESIQFKHSDYLKTLQEGDSVIKLSNDKLAIVKEVQTEPVSGKLLHVSLQGVVKGEKFTQDVKLVLTHDEKCDWAKEGMQLRQVVDSLTVETTPSNLPEVISVDVSGLTADNNLKLKDVKAPEGVEFLGDEEMDLASVAFAKVEVEEEETETVDSEAENPESVEETKEDSQDQ